MNKKIYDAIIGFAIGDAFGVPYEFWPRNSVKSDHMIGHGTWNQPSGTWSDDTSMTLATLDAITEKGLDPKDVADNFIKWCMEKKYTPRGKVFDIGKRTSEALEYYYKNKKFLDDSDNINSNGNGSLMRILPLAFIDASYDLINEISAITHPHDISKTCCRIYVYFVKFMLDHPDAKINELCDYMIMLNRSEGNILDLNKILSMTSDNISSTAYVVDTLEAVFWTFFHTDSYKDAIITATNLGSDTDTIAAITGGIAGIFYGIDEIPDEWSLCNAQEIIRITEKALKSVEKVKIKST